MPSGARHGFQCPHRRQQTVCNQALQASSAPTSQQSGLTSSLPPLDDQRTRSRKTGNDDIKGALWISAEAYWVGKHGNDLMEAVKRVRPAMNQEQRDGIGSFPMFIEKMD